MPQEAIKRGAAEKIVPLDQVARTLLSLAHSIAQKKQS
jgi:chemotaxis response regulator CheB